MAITLLVGVVPLTVESGQTVFLTPSSQIQVVVDGVVIDPSTITVNVTPPDATLTLPDGQVVTLAGFVDETGQAGGGLVDANGEVVVASTLEGLTQAAAGPAPTPAPSPEALEPGAGGQAGGPGGVDAGGSSIAVVTYFEDGFGNLFGVSPSGEFVSLALPPFDVVPFEELPLLLEDEVLVLVAEAIGEFLLFTDSLVPGFEGLTNPTSPDDFAFFNNPSAPLFSGGTLNLAFDDVSGSSGVPFDLNITNSMNGNDTVELADAGNPNGNNLKELFGVPTAFYGGTGDDTLTGGTDHDIIVGDGQQAGNSVMDCGDEKKGEKDYIEELNGEGGKRGHHDAVVLAGDNDSLFGGDGDDVLIGDGLVSKPGYGPQSNIGFPNLVTPPSGDGSSDASMMAMEANLLHNFVVGMFGPGGKKEVLNIEVEKQAKIKVVGGEDSLFGGEGDDLVVGDGLVVIEGRPSHHRGNDKDQPFIEDEGIETQGDFGRKGHGESIKVRGGNDTLEGNDGDDKLVGDGIARLPSALFGNPHGGHDEYGERGDGFEHLGLRETKVKLFGGEDTIEGNDGSDKLIGDGIVNVQAASKGGMVPYGGDCSPCPAEPQVSGGEGGGRDGVKTLIKGGDDLMFGDSPDDAMGKKVAVFDNPDFVDTSDDGFIIFGIADAESDEVQATLRALGHEVMTFTGITAAEIEAALDGKDVFLIPELEQGRLAGALSEAALDVIRDFVRDGGKLIIHGSFSSEPGGNGETAQFLNELFGYSLAERGDDADTVRTPSAAGTFLANGPDGLSGLNATNFLTGLPENGISVYESDDVPVGDGSGDTMTGSSVALFEEGTGHVLYLGYDWFNAIPGPGQQDGGWVELLDIAVRMDMGANDDVMLGDGILNASLGGKDFRSSSDVQVSGGEGGDRKGGKTVLAGGDDEMHGGLGDDKMVGDAILNAHAGGQDGLATLPVAAFAARDLNIIQPGTIACRNRRLAQNGKQGRVLPCTPR